MSEFLEGGPFVFINHQYGSPPDQVVDLASFCDQWGPFVERDFVYSEVGLVIGQETDQRFPDGPGPDYMNDFHLCSLDVKREA
jgi:hypothetical protein